MPVKTSTRKKKKAAAKPTTGEAEGPRVAIVSLDGGGIRGLMTAVWLARLETLLAGRLRDFCDIIAGTSTGAILGGAVALGIPASEIVQLYETEGRRIFPGEMSRLWSRFKRTITEGLSAPKYPEGGLEGALRDKFGNSRLGDVPEHLCLLVTSYNTLTRQATVLKSSTSPGKEMYLWEAAKASASAPTYFPAHLTRLHGADAPLIDGGVVANNPTLCAIAEAAKGALNRPPALLSEVVVGSFGTGESTREITIAEAREWGALEWAIPIISVLFDGAGDATDYVAGQLIRGERYQRLQCRLDEAYDDLDDASTTNLNALKGLSNDYLDSRGGLVKLEKLADLLKRCKARRDAGT